MSTYDSRPDTYEHIGKVRARIGECVKNLLDRADRHDLTKLADPEKEAFDRMTPILATLEYGSPEYKASTKALGPALQHHYEHNSHHPEHYEDGVEGMSLLDLVEMVCDWRAASERMRAPGPGDFERSVRLNQERWGYSDELASILLNTGRELGYVAALEPVGS